MIDKLQEIANMEKLLKDNPDGGIMRKWSLQTYICQLKGEKLPPYPIETPKREQPTQTLEEGYNEGEISDEMYDFLKDELDASAKFTLGKIKDKYWELKSN